VSKFLDDQDLGPAIRNLLQGSRPRCAVAFWGDGASSALFPNKALPADARIICDITMGGSNPKELRALGAPEDARIKHLRGLHAKVYISERGLIACSANASSNGIGFLVVASLVEAGTFHGPESEAYSSAALWFESVWDRASIVDKTTLDDAQRAWNRKPRGPSGPGRVPNPASLFDAVADNPSRFRGVGFAFTTGESTTVQRNETIRAVINEDKELDVPLLSTRDRRTLSSWPVGHVFSEWAPEDINAWPKRFVCAHRGARSGRFSYWFYERVHTTVLEGGRGMVLARRQGSLRKELGFKHGVEAMAEADAHRASLIFSRIDESGHHLYESGEKLAQLLADLS
jgi:hypothetical protein